MELVGPMDLNGFPLAYLDYIAKSFPTTPQWDLLFTKIALWQESGRDAPHYGLPPLIPEIYVAETYQLNTIIFLCTMWLLGFLLHLVLCGNTLLWMHHHCYSRQTCWKIISLSHGLAGTMCCGHHSRKTFLYLSGSCHTLESQSHWSNTPSPPFQTNVSGSCHLSKSWSCWSNAPSPPW